MVATTHPAWLTRQALLARAGATLPLGRSGDGIRTRLRETPAGERAALVRTWREALDRLHRAGWGTEDVVRAALVTAAGRVRFLPDLVWPLGALHAARPIAGWLDLEEASHWLTRAGASEQENAAFAATEPPWPSWPAAPAPGPIALIGPVRETAALAEAAGIPWLPAAHLRSDVARRWILDALMTDRPWCISVSTEAALAELPLLPLAMPNVAGGSPLALTGAERASLDMHAAVEDPPDMPQFAAPSREALTRRLEDAALAAQPQARANGEALALLDGLGQAQFDRPLAELDTRLDRVVALARTAGNRQLSAKATYHRGLLRCLSAHGAHFDAGLKDLTDARRLAAAQDMGEAAGIYAASKGIAETLQRRRTSPDTVAPPSESAAAALPAVVSAWRRLSTGLQILASNSSIHLDSQALRTLLNAALLLDAPFVLAAVTEGVGAAAMIAGEEAAGERLIVALSRAALSPEARALVTAWRALLAARRGATLSARESILAVASQLEGARVTPERPGSLWWERAALICALAAKAQGNEGLATHFVALVGAQDTLIGRLATTPPPLERFANRPRWWQLLAAEAAADRRESDARQTRVQLLNDLGSDNPAEWSPGFALALGRLAIRSHEPGAARVAFQIAATGERHVEQRALEQLATLADPDEAVLRRLAQLQAQTLPNPTLDLPPPLTVDQAITAELAAIRRAAIGAAGIPEDPWRGAVEALTGPTLDPPPRPHAATHGVQIDRDSDGNWQIEAGVEVARLAGPPEVSPRTCARALHALAPIFAAESPATGKRSEAPTPEELLQGWAASIDDALIAREADFDEAVIAPFKRHDLTRAQVRWLLHRGLTATTGSYRALAARWAVDEDAYQRFMDFLRRANAALDFRPYRRPDQMPTTPG